MNAEGNKGSVETEFSRWVAEWGPSLWYLVEDSHEPDELNSQEFVEFIEKVRNSATRRAPRTGDVERVRLFVSEWLAAQPSKLDRQATEDRILLEGLFRLKWSPDLVATLVKASGRTSLRFRAFEALKRRARLGLEETRFRTRDCARADLEFLADRLGASRSDPLGMGIHREMLEHAALCPRCGRLRKRLEAEIETISDGSLSPVPSSFFAEVAEVRSLSARVGVLRLFSRWPWFVRLPFQLMAAYVVVFAVLAIPHLEEIVPEWTAFRERLGRVASIDLGRKSLPSPEVVATPPPEPVASVTSPVAPSLALPVAIATPPPPSVTPRGSVTAPVPPVTAPSVAAVAATPVEPSVISVAASPLKVAPPQGGLFAWVDSWRTRWREKTPSPLPVASVSVAAEREAPVTSKPEVPPAKVAETKPISGAPEAASESATSSVAERRFYRWGAYTGRLSADGDRILAILTKYGAEKAGDLALGAPYRGGRYFHFAVTAEQFNELSAEIRALGLGNLTESEATSWRRTPLSQRRVVFVLQPEGSNPARP